MSRTQSGATSGAPVDLIVALDVDHGDAAMRLVDALGDECDFYKVGLELFAAAGPPIVTLLRKQGKRVFVDLKLHDIPNTVRGAARSVARLGASLLTVHATGGEEMVRAAVAGAAEGSADAAHQKGVDGACGILAVTVLTSLNDEVLSAVWGRSTLHAVDEVRRLARLAHGAGARGIVCSGQEVGSIKGEFGDALEVLVPGIRPAGGQVHDQSRVVTPEAAARDGARWLVLGRAVTAASDPRQTLRAIRESVERIQGANVAG